ncbi:MAG: phenylalanine--tRNA ligase subunit beta [Clostridia bacterium]|nr:phenylalanine--tRNA ligase subunit beta [Clostridia bacterium]MBR2908710.1 phenylalanine--tRNA ligase subunit beta [Clostridia bacterium]
MNLSMNWLSDFVSTEGITSREYCDRMTDTGSKVEGYEALGQDIDDVVVGKIVRITPHENSDHLQICMIDVGKSDLVQIVTGAQNVFEGAYVPAALAPASLPGGVVIKAGKLRGVESNGMLCSFSELSLTEHDCPGKYADGILILDESDGVDDSSIGKSIVDVLALSDVSVEFEITSNRPDCMSVIGLARETAVSFDRPWTLKAPVVKGAQDGDRIENHLSVKIDCPDLCSRYSARVVKNVKIGPSPLWMRRRLRASGVRPINNIVDITNYVMLEYGQPMHAFDYKCLSGSEIVVRRARDNEIFRSLDSQDHTLDSSMMVISDRDKAVALAGVMGGENSEITESTATVVFESAMFLGSSVRVTAKKNGMRTESSARFEKGLDAENCLPALERACELVELLGAGDVVDGIIDVYPVKKEKTVLPLDVDRINRFLGTSMTEEFMVSVMEKLGCTVTKKPCGCISLEIPTFRADLGCMNDIAEEVLRIYGYNEIASTCINAETCQGGRTKEQQFVLDTVRMLCGAGLSEIQTYSFISPKYYDKIRMPADSAMRNSVVISNPLGEDTSVMRTTALPSMLEVLTRNYNFSNENARFFELATVYHPTTPSTLPDEKPMLTLGAYGDSDFYSMKGLCEAVLKLAGVKGYTFRANMENPTFHPGRCAEVLDKNGNVLGVFGQAHPLTAKNYGVNIPLYLAELSMGAIFALHGPDKHFTPLPKFPSVSRDFSFVCSEEIEVGTITATMTRAGGALVESVKLFDIYRGEKLGANMKSVSMRVILRAPDRTLTVEEADKVSRKILGAVEHQLGITLRA